LKCAPGPAVADATRGSPLSRRVALCGSREDAEDLVQETFTRVLARPRVLSGDDELYYLMRVLRNTFLTSRRTASRRPSRWPRSRTSSQPTPATGPARAGAGDAGGVRDDCGAAGGSPSGAGGRGRARPSYREAARALRVREATITNQTVSARKQVAHDLTDAPAAPQTQVQTTRREETRAGGVLPSRGTR